MQLTLHNPQASCVVIDKGYIPIPEEIQKQAYIFKEDIGEILSKL